MNVTPEAPGAFTRREPGEGSPQGPVEMLPPEVQSTGARRRGPALRYLSVTSYLALT